MSTGKSAGRTGSSGKRVDKIAPKGGVNAVETASLLLRALSETPGPARLADIARVSGIPSAKCHRYLVSLIRGGLVEQDEASSRYDLGPLALRAGIVALSRSDAVKRAERFLNAIVEHTGETAAAAVWGTHGPTLVRLVEARHELASSVPLGHVCAMTFSGAGLIFCAFGEPHLVDPLVKRELAQSRKAGRRGVPFTAAELQVLVAPVKKGGFAQVEVEENRGLAAVSVPVFGADNRLQFAISVFGRAGRLNTSTTGPIVALMVDSAKALTAELQGAPSTLR